MNIERIRQGVSRRKHQRARRAGVFGRVCSRFIICYQLVMVAPARAACAPRVASRHWASNMAPRRRGHIFARAADNAFQHNACAILAAQQRADKTGRKAVAEAVYVIHREKGCASKIAYILADNRQTGASSISTRTTVLIVWAHLRGRRNSNNAHAQNIYRSCACRMLLLRALRCAAPLACISAASTNHPRAATRRAAPYRRAGRNLALSPFRHGILARRRK